MLWEREGKGGKEERKGRKEGREGGRKEGRKERERGGEGGKEGRGEGRKDGKEERKGGMGGGRREGRGGGKGHLPESVHAKLAQLTRFLRACLVSCMEVVGSDHQAGYAPWLSSKKEQ